MKTPTSNIPTIGPLYADDLHDSLQLTKKQLTIWTDGKARSFVL
jgi:hypothetical protein